MTVDSLRDARVKLAYECDSNMNAKKNHEFEQDDGELTDVELQGDNAESAEIHKRVTESTEKSSAADDPDAKPAHSYIALIAMAILSKPSKKVLLGDIYAYISDKFPYYRSKDKSWRNSIRHNLSLNECFIKAGRSENGKGNYWAIHPANVEDFANGDFRRRRARRRVRKSHSGLYGARYTTFPFPHYPYVNYRASEYCHQAANFCVNPFTVPTCARKSTNFGIENLIASQRIAPPSPMDYSVPLSYINRVYATPNAPYANNGQDIVPCLATTHQTPITESWNDTWRKLKARFHPAQ